MYEYGNSQCVTWFLPLMTMVFVMFVIVNYGLIEDDTDLRARELRKLSLEAVQDGYLSKDMRMPKDGYKKFIAPDYGTIRLVKGMATQVHHSIKTDSVIVVSRKTIDGMAGTHLVVKEIVPNEKFTVMAVDSTGNVVVDDCGEVFFVVY